MNNQVKILEDNMFSRILRLEDFLREFRDNMHMLNRRMMQLERELEILRGDDE